MKDSYYEQKELWIRDLTPQEKEKIRIVKSILPEDVKTILDVGCGSGSLTNYLEKYDIYGVDISFTALKAFKNKKIRASISNLPFKDASFDLVICSDVLEHLPKKVFEKALQELKRVTKKYLLIISPNNEPLEAVQTKCHYCGTIFHINHHIRRLNLTSLIEAFKDSFSPILYTYFGDFWSVDPPVKLKAKRALGFGFKYWPHAICPLCGENQNKNSSKNPIENHLDNLLECIFNDATSNFFPGFTEVLILFSKKDNNSKIFNAFRKENREVILTAKKLNNIYTTSQYFIKPYYDFFVKNFTTPYPYYPYILDNAQSQVANKGIDIDGEYREIINRCVIFFPKKDFKKLKYLTFKLKPLTKGIVYINVFDSVQSYINIYHKKVKSLELIENTIPIDRIFQILSPPKEGITIEILIKDLKGTVSGKIRLYEVGFSKKGEETKKIFTKINLRDINFSPFFRPNYLQMKVPEGLTIKDNSLLISPEDFMIYDKKRNIVRFVPKFQFLKLSEIL